MKREKGHISPETIKKVIDSMNIVFGVIRKNKGTVTGRDIIGTWCHGMLLTSMKRSGYISSIGRGLYRANIPSAEPIHARKLIEAVYATQKSYKEKMVVINPKPIKQNRPTPQPAVTRTVSILWGLLKWSK